LMLDDVVSSLFCFFDASPTDHLSTNSLAIQIVVSSLLPVVDKWNG